MRIPKMTDSQKEACKKMIVEVQATTINKKADPIELALVIAELSTFLALCGKFGAFQEWRKKVYE